MLNSSIISHHRRLPCKSQISHSHSLEKRRRGLIRLDRELRKGNHDNAIAIVKQLGRQPHGLRGFGSAKQVPKRLSSLDYAGPTGMGLAHLSSLVDAIHDSIQGCIEESRMEETTSWNSRLRAANQSSFGRNTEEGAVVEEGNATILPQYDIEMCARHEAGHFLAGYLLGVLPKEYRLPNKDNLCKKLNIGGAVKFVGFEFLREVPDANFWTKPTTTREKYYKVKNRPVSSKTFNNFSCVVLGGIVAEQLSFGCCEGLHSDMHQLTRVIQWLGLTTSDAHAHIRWAAINTAFILQQHHQTTTRLADAMKSGSSVGHCIETIEQSLLDKS